MPKCKRCGETHKSKKHKSKKDQTNCETECKALIEVARATYGSDEIEIDDEASISRSPGKAEGADEGTWVQAWVWVANEA